MKMNNYKTVDEYLSNFEGQTRSKLDELRNIIRKQVPEAGEKISYGIPTYTLQGNLIHFGGYPHHVSLYPGAAAVVHFQEELKNYKTSKGTIQFPLDQSLPKDLIKLIVRLCVQARGVKQRK